MLASDFKPHARGMLFGLLLLILGTVLTACSVKEGVSNLIHFIGGDGGKAVGDAATTGAGLLGMIPGLSAVGGALGIFAGIWSRVREVAAKRKYVAVIASGNAVLQRVKDVLGKVKEDGKIDLSDLQYITPDALRDLMAETQNGIGELKNIAADIHALREAGKMIKVR